MKLNRRHFLASLMAVGATIALPVPLAQATTAQVNTAWKQLLKDPWFFAVNADNTITDTSIGEPKFRHQVFDVCLCDQCTPDSLVSDIEDCEPLASHFQQLALDELDEVRFNLDDDALTRHERRRLERLEETLEDDQEGWRDWVLLAGPKGLPRFQQLVKAWLASPIGSDDYEWLPSSSTAQGSAMGFFESLPRETLKALGVVIVDGEHPGSTYYAAELCQPITNANAVATELGLPFRFEPLGSSVVGGA